MLYLEIHTVDVRQGDCQFIAIKDASGAKIVQLIMIDIGNGSTKHVVSNYWCNNFNQKKVDKLFISHWDSDHYGGGSKNIFPKNLLYLSKKGLFVNNCPLYSPSISRPPLNGKSAEAFVYCDIRLGDSLHFENIKISCHAIDKAILPFDSVVGFAVTPTNRSSIALLVHDQWRNYYYYTGGDLSSEEENQLANPSHPFNKIDGFKLSHHGSKTSTPPEFLRNIIKEDFWGSATTIAICSHGNRHKHPDAETIKRLQAAKVKTILTNPIKETANNEPYIAFAGSNSRTGEIRSQKGNIVQRINGFYNTVEAWFTASQLKNLYTYFLSPLDGQYSIGEYWRSSVKGHISYTLAEGTPIIRFLGYLPAGTEHRFIDDHTCEIPDLPVELPNGILLKDSILTDNNKTLHLKGYLAEISLSGTVSEAGVAELNMINSGSSIEILSLIKLIGPQMAEGFPSFLSPLLGRVSVVAVEFIHDFKEKNKTSIFVSAELKKEITVSENIKFEHLLVDLNSIYGGEDQMMFFFIGRIKSSLVINNETFKIHIDLSRNLIWELVIEPQDLSLADIASIIPGFDSETLQDWASTLALDKIDITKAAIEVDFGNQNSKMDSLSLGLNINIFSKYTLALTLAYRPGTGMSVYGGILESMKVYDLLAEFGLQENHYKFFPNVKIEEFAFSAVPATKTYSINVKIESEFTYNLGDLKCGIKTFTFEIEKSSSKTSVKASLYGSVTKSELTGNSADDGQGIDILIAGSYETDAGFAFRGELWNLDSNDFLKLFGIQLPEEIIAPKFEHLQISTKPFTVISTLETGFTFEILGKYLSFRINEFEYIKDQEWKISGTIDFFGLLTRFKRDNKEIRISIAKFSFSDLLQVFTENSDITKHFDFDLKNMEIVISKGSFSFEVDITKISIGEAIRIGENKLQFGIKNKELSFGIETRKLQIITGDRTFSTAGGLKVSTKKLSFYGKSNDSFRDVFGIKDFNFGQLFISINQQLQPPAFAIGFMGNLMFKKVSGSIALYISPNMPSEQLLAVTFSGLTLHDITEGVVGELNPGLEDIFKSIGLVPIEMLPAVLPIPEVQEGVTEEMYQAIMKIDPDTSRTDLMLKSYEDYTWISQGTYLVENEDKFRQYQLFPSGEPKKYALSKYVTFYGCLSPTGIDMNGRHFDTGFAFSGNIKFLGVEQLVNFHANPKQGLFLYYEMKQSIKIGSVLRLSRVGDDSKGPILSLSTYAHNRHFILAAKLELFDGLFQYGVRIVFANSQFSFILYYEVFGFRSAIMVNSNWKSLEQATFAIQYQFVTSGFSNVTQYIADKLYQKADEINRAIQDARRKLDNAQRTVLEYQRNIDNVSNSIKNKIAELENLKRTNYPWYQAYKYVELGVRILAVGIEIGALGAYKVAQILLLEAALAVLKIADEIFKKTGQLSNEVIKGLADVIAAIGKGIDWLILIHKVEASLAISDESRKFRFNFEFRLAGTERKENFELEHNGKLSEMLIEQIEKFFGDRKLMSSQFDRLEAGSDVTEELDNIYGKISQEEKREILIADNEKMEKEFKDISSENQSYRDVITHQDLLSTIKYIFEEFDVNEKKGEEDHTSGYTNQMDQESVVLITRNLSEALKNLEQEEFFDSDVKEQSTEAIDNLNNLLKENYSTMLMSSAEDTQYFSSLFNETELKISRFRQVNLRSSQARSKEIERITELMEFMDDMAHHANEQSAEGVKKNAFRAANQIDDDRPSIQAVYEIIKKYNKLINSVEVHDYMKIDCYVNIGIGYFELGDRGNSIYNLRAGLNLAASVLGKASQEYFDIKQLIKNTWDIDVE